MVVHSDEMMTRLASRPPTHIKCPGAGARLVRPLSRRSAVLAEMQTYVTYVLAEWRGRLFVPVHDLRRPDRRREQHA